MAASILAFSSDLKEFKHHRLFGDFRADKTFKTHWSEFKFASKFEILSPCLSSGNHFQRLLQKIIEGFDCKINGSSLGVTLRHNLDGLDWRAQTIVCCSH